METAGCVPAVSFVRGLQHLKSGSSSPDTSDGDVNPAGALLNFKIEERRRLKWRAIGKAVTLVMV
jgi:hypothetical protein